MRLLLQMKDWVFPKQVCLVPYVLPLSLIFFIEEIWYFLNWGNFEMNEEKRVSQSTILSECVSTWRKYVCGGIRTLGATTHDALAMRSLKPLGHANKTGDCLNGWGRTRTCGVSLWLIYSQLPSPLGNSSMGWPGGIEPLVCRTTICRTTIVPWSHQLPREANPTSSIWGTGILPIDQRAIWSPWGSNPTSPMWKVGVVSC